MNMWVFLIIHSDSQWDSLWGSISLALILHIEFLDELFLIFVIPVKNIGGVRHVRQ